MIGLIAGVGVGLAWLGAATFALSDARRGQAVGLLGAAAGLALARAAEGSLLEGGLLLAGGLLAAGVGLRGNQRRGWGVLQAGSTPGIVLCFVVGGAALWFGAGLIDAPGPADSRAAATILMALGAGRLFGVHDPRSALGAASLVALGAGGLSTLASGSITGSLLGALAAIALNLVPAGPEGELESG